MGASGYALVVAAALASAAPPAMSNDRLVVPGARIGPVRLEATVADLIRAYGRPRRTLFLAGLPPEADAVHDHLQLYWYSLGVGVITVDERRVECLVVPFEYSYRPYRTERGVTHRASRAQVRAMYGAPTAETRITEWSTRLIYDTLGIAFTFDAGGRMRGVYVFRPGTAGHIWHLL